MFIARSDINVYLKLRDEIARDLFPMFREYAATQEHWPEVIRNRINEFTFESIDEEYAHFSNIMGGEEVIRSLPLGFVFDREAWQADQERKRQAVAEALARREEQDAAAKERRERDELHRLKQKYEGR